MATDGAPAASTSDRIVAAALAQFEDFGLRRTTVDDIARGAGPARVTGHRHFPSKEAIVRAVLVEEVERFFTALDERIAPHMHTEDRLVEGFAFALGFVRGHALLNRLLQTELEAILPYLTAQS